MDVAIIRQDEQQWYQRLHGAADVSWTYTRANDQTQLAANANLTYTTSQWDASAETHSDISSVAGIKSGNRTQNTVQLTRHFGHRLLEAGFGNFLKSAEQNLDLRGTYGGGVGRDLIRGHRTRLRILVGLVATQERYSEASGGSQQSSLEAVVSGTHSFFTFKNASFLGTASLYPSLSDSRPPLGGLGVDYGANTGIGYTF